MKQKLIAMALCLFAMCQIHAQKLEFSTAKFQLGDQKEWSDASFNDQSWKQMSILQDWSVQGVTNPQGYAWYRIHFTMPKSLLENSDLKKVVNFAMGKIDDADETYLNGVLIGKTGGMPGDKNGYSSNWSAERNYVVDASKGPIRWDAENVLAVRVYNGNDPGGMFEGSVRITVPNLMDGLSISFSEEKNKKGEMQCVTTLSNRFDVAQKGTITLEAMDMENNKQLSTSTKKVSMKSKSINYATTYDQHLQTRIIATYRDANSGKELKMFYTPKYILTPAAPAAPRYNGALVYGARPGSPIIFKIAVSGEKPIRYSVKGLPEGLKVDAEKGVLSGSLRRPGEYKMTFVAENAKGKIEQDFSLKIGGTIALTPPMGWNSWNCWGLSISQERVMSSARALIEKGLIDYGYAYVNIDDAWEAAERNADGTIAVNDKFPDMAGLGEWLHEQGFKFGIYSSPGDLTCGGYLGTLGHEEQDAQTYNSWGIDYLKYDWCGYSREFDKSRDRSVAAYVRPYLVMEKYLREQPRDIFYSLCQYGMADVWKWGHAVDANSWRTTGDITDTWQSLYNIGFESQHELYPYAAPGHWNDPDMLIVGKVGWSSSLRDSRLTPDEQYTHISLWSLLASNMLIGCDVSQIDEFTLNLLCNNEVNAVNQDILGKQAQRLIQDKTIQVWKRPLADGSYAIGIFNLSNEDTNVDFSKYLPELGIKGLKSVRDLWRQKDISTTDLNYFIPTHGVKFIKVTY